VGVVRKEFASDLAVWLEAIVWAEAAGDAGVWVCFTKKVQAGNSSKARTGDNQERGEAVRGNIAYGLKSRKHRQPPTVQGQTISVSR
jgi:hypothetical protein